MFDLQLKAYIRMWRHSATYNRQHSTHYRICREFVAMLSNVSAARGEGRVPRSGVKNVVPFVFGRGT